MLLIKIDKSIPYASFINKFTIVTAIREIIICVIIGLRNNKKDFALYSKQETVLP